LGLRRRQRGGDHGGGEEQTRPDFHISLWVAANRSGLGSALCSRQTFDAERQPGLSPEMGRRPRFWPIFPYRANQLSTFSAGSRLYDCVLS
jgi:hypothetical protein